MLQTFDFWIIRGRTRCRKRKNREESEIYTSYGAFAYKHGSIPEDEILDSQ